MRYYIGNMEFDPDYLEHYGVKGMKWGKHRSRRNNAIRDWWTGKKYLDDAKIASYKAEIMEDVKQKRMREHDETDQNIWKKARAYPKVIRNATAQVATAYNYDNYKKDMAYIVPQKRAYIRVAEESIEKYRKAPRQVVAKTIRDGKTRVAYILNKIKAIGGRKKR